jgi:chromosome segregation ATPase
MEERGSQQERRLASLEAQQSRLCREFEAMRQEVKAEVAALLSEVVQLRKSADAATRLAQEAQNQLVAEVKQQRACWDEAKARETEQERWHAALEAKQSQLAWLPADLARVTSEVQTALAQLRASAEAARRQPCGEVERLQSEISGLQVQAEVGQLRKPGKHSGEAAQE